MTTGDDVDWYLRTVVRLATARRTVVEAVDVSTRLARQDIERALTDPFVLLDGLDTAAVRDRVDRLLRFALWLEDPANTDLAPDLASRAARYRFLVWSLPLRFPPARFDKVCPAAVGWAGRTPTSIIDVLPRARTARTDWIGHLSTADDDPWLSALQAGGDPRIERDMRWITARWPVQRPGRETTVPDGPLDLVERDAGRRLRHGQRYGVAADLAESHWLPRASLLAAAAAFGWPRRWRLPALTVFPLACALVATLVLTGQGEVARWASVGVLAAGAFTVAMLPTRVDALALLRIPAAAAAGQALLLSLTPRWWQSTNGWAVGAAMLTAVALYILIEARLHGVERWPAAGRALLLAAVGSLYGFVLSVAFLGFVVPAMGENGHCLNGWWNTEPFSPLPLAADCAADPHQLIAGSPAGVLLLMTGWSLAVGTAAQILWDDRPLTAPLGRLRRVRGAKP